MILTSMSGEPEICIYFSQTISKWRSSLISLSWQEYFEGLEMAGKPPSNYLDASRIHDVPVPYVRSSDRTFE